MKLSYKSVRLPFKYPFTISRGTKTHQPSLLVELEFHGIKAYGEAPAIDYYGITVEQMIADLEAKKSFLEKYAFVDPERFWHYLHHLFPRNSFLVCALDMAGWDLYGKLRKQPLYALWELDYNSTPLTDLTIGLDDPAIMLEKMQAQPWPIYKVKMGGKDDLQILRSLRAHTSVPLRVDANAGWTADWTKQTLPALEELQIELIEQPLEKNDWEGMKNLFSASRIPLIADESCVGEKDLEKMNGHFHGINIKLTKCGGITPALRMIADARSKGLKVMLGSMNECTVGTSALAHLLPYADYADLDGPLLLKEDVAHGLTFKEGKVVVSNALGLGITLYG